MEKSLDSFKVSLYENKFSKKPVEVSLYEVMRDIKKGKYAEAINRIRRYFDEGDKRAAQYEKGKLPCFTASGTFDGAHAICNLKKHTGIILLDCDDVKDILALREACINDPHTVFSFNSPTNGYKIGVYVEGAERNHRAAYQLVSNYYQELTGVACDAACKDESRLCYVSEDEKAYVAPFYEAFVLPEEERNMQPEERGEEKSGQSENVYSCSTALPEAPDEEIADFVLSYLFLYPMREGQRNLSLFKLACEACRRGYEKGALIRAVLPRFEDDSFPKQEVVNAVSSGYKRVSDSGKGGLSGYNEQNKRSKVSKVSFDLFPENEGQEEAYWSGEEFRRNTPCFPEEVYKNIPDMLRMGISDDLNVREKDLLLLSLLTAYSAIMPCTWGTYNHKRYAPNLFTLGIAPAGSGKSVAQWAEKLLEMVQNEIVEESNREQVHYQVQRMEWQAACAEKMKKKEKIDYKEMPKEPPYRMPVISASTSRARMLIQLRDNGDMGAIIVDTEAQSMINANSQDYGHFDDMICKAYEHETISASFKVNGITPVIVPYPKLSILLTGTPEQVYSLLENVGNGKPSRFLIYTFRQDPIWKEMGESESDREDLFSSLAPQAYRLYHFCRQHVCMFRFKSAHWNRLNTTFRRMLADVVTDGNDHMQAVVKRYGCMVLRVAMILTRLRHFEDQLPGEVLVCEDRDFETAMAIVTCCYEHSRLIITSMPTEQKHALKNPYNKKGFYDALPEKFTTNEALELGVKWTLSSATVKRLLKVWNGVKISKLSHGVYQKLK